jgi:hypothetical protein
MFLATQNQPSRTRSGVREDLWAWTLPAQDENLLAIQPATKEHPVIVVLQVVGVVYGLDGRTGVQRWRCEVEGHPASLLETAGEQGLPRVVFVNPRGPGSVICRQALPTDASGKYRSAAATPMEYGPAPEDPRLLRPLPWWAELQSLGREDIGSLLWDTVWGLLMLALGAFLPGWLIAQTVRKRPWKWGLGALSWLVLLASTATLFYHFQVLFYNRTYPLREFLIGLPVLAVCYYSLRRLYERRWHSLLFILGWWTITSAVVATVWLIIDTTTRVMIPEEHYVWTGWYTILLVGLIPTGGLL